MKKLTDTDRIYLYLQTAETLDELIELKNDLIDEYEEEDVEAIYDEISIWFCEYTGELKDVCTCSSCEQEREDAEGDRMYDDISTEME